MGLSVSNQEANTMSVTRAEALGSAERSLP